MYRKQTVERARPLAALIACCLLLAGCPDDDGRAAPAAPETAAFSGTVSFGMPIESFELRVGAFDTPPRTTRIGASGRYEVSALGLTAPAIIGVQDTLYAAATDLSAPAQVTALTHLQLVEVLRDDPVNALRNAVNTRSSSTAVDYAPITAAALARAQARVVSLLRERLAFELPAAVAAAGFVATPFSNTPGDPTYDALAALDAALSANGSSLIVLVRDRVRELEPCTRFFVDLRIGGAVSEFCANTRETIADNTAGDAFEYRYTALDGSTLRVRAAGSTVTSVRLDQASGAAYACESAACAGLAISAADADGRRELRFAQLALAAADGSAAATLGGSIGTALPGLPPLDCDGARRPPQPVYVTADDGSISGLCISLSFGNAGARSIYRDLSSGAQRLSIHADDTAAASIGLYRLDNLGRRITDYRCEGSACLGFSAGPLFALPGSLRNREQRLVDTRLSRVGNGSGPASVTVRGTLTVALGIETTPPACALSPPSERLRARVSNETADWDICPPYDLSENGTVRVDRVSALDYGGRYTGGLRYSFENATAIPGSLVVVTTLGVVRRVEYSRGRAISSETGRLDDELMLCDGLACRGAEIDPANAQTGHVLRFAGVLLSEERYDGSAADRQVRLDGALLSAPDCLASGSCP